MSPRTSIVAIRRVTEGVASVDHDLVAVESAVAIELTQIGRPAARAMGVLMRTPGDDEDLVRGWLYTERIIHSTGDIVSTGVFTSDQAAPDSPGDKITVTLSPHIDLDSLIENRSLTPTSACGLCGRLAAERVDQLRDNGGRPRAADRPGLEAAVISSLPSTLRDGQAVFAETGGLHAAGLFDLTGRLLALREDVGRHNAVDKLVGAALTAGWLPATEAILAVSGRVAYEIVQKAAAAGVAGLVAVGAPSSLAVEAARTIGLTLVGFARDGRFNVYAGHDRLR
jgi:FdhD protein